MIYKVTKTKQAENEYAALTQEQKDCGHYTPIEKML